MSTLLTNTPYISVREIARIQMNRSRSETLQPHGSPDGEHTQVLEPPLHCAKRDKTNRRTTH